jgi:hypothetical protein
LDNDSFAAKSPTLLSLNIHVYVLIIMKRLIMNSIFVK